MKDLKKILFSSIWYVSEYKTTLIRLLFLPASFLFVIDLASYYVSNYYLYLLFSILSLVVVMVFSIKVYRIFLLGPEVASGDKLLQWSKRETYSLLYLVGLLFLIVILSFIYDLFLMIFLSNLPGMVIGFGVLISSIVSSVLFCWLIGRLSLAFPGIAIDKGISFAYSWKLSNNHQVLMTVIFFLNLMLLKIPDLILLISSHLFFVASIVEVVFCVYACAIVAMAYHYISLETRLNKETSPA